MNISYLQLPLDRADYYRSQIKTLADRTLGSTHYNDPWSADRLDFKLECCLQDGTVILALDEGRVVGSTFGHTVDHALSQGIVLEVPEKDYPITFFGAGLFVSPDYSKQGIGSTLIRMRLAYFQRLGYRYFATITNAQGPHISLYRKLSYQFGKRITNNRYRNPKVIIRAEISEIIARLEPARVSKNDPWESTLSPTMTS